MSLFSRLSNSSRPSLQPIRKVRLNLEVLEDRTLLSGAYTSKVYHNDGNNTFTNVTTISNVLTPVAFSSVAWGDYDNDGKLDILLAGRTSGGFASEVYHNDGNNSFHNITANLSGVHQSS